MIIWKREGDAVVTLEEYNNLFEVEGRIRSE